MANSRNNVTRRPRRTYNDSTRYNISSNAYDYAYEQEEIPQFEKRRRKVKKQSKKQGITYVKVKEESAISSSAILTVVGLFLCAILCVALRSNVKNQSVKNSALRAQLKQEEARTADLTIEVSNATNIDIKQIEEIARKKLNMSEPKEHQIRPINVNKQSYTVYYETSETKESTEDEGILSFGFIKKTLGK